MLWIALIISGAVFSVFVLNLMLYSFVPAYRAALLMTSAGEDSSIPVIEVESDVTILQDETTPLAPIIEEKSSDEEIDEEKNKKIFEENKLQIVERTYYEDCGTGHGYWVLKYSDGSLEIE